MTAASQRSVSEWERLLLEMDDAYTNYVSEDEDSYYTYLPLENDDDAAPLAEALQSTAVAARMFEHSFELFLEIEPGFTERGAHVLAKGIHQSKVRRIRANADDDEHIAASVVRILYLEGNKPSFESDCDGLVFAVHYARLELNDRNFTDCYVGVNGTDPILLSAAMHGNTELKTLSFLGGRNRFTAEGSRALAAAIRDCKVTRLAFDHFDDDDNEELLRIICEDGIKPSERLFEITGRLCASLALANILPSLTRLWIQNSAPLNIGLLQGLNQLSFLSDLCLSNCGLGDDGISILSQMLYGNRSIRILRLQYNHVGDAGIIAFAQNSRPDSPLVFLELNGNDFGVTGLRHLLTAAGELRALHSLELRGCRNIGHLGLQLIGREMPNLKLTTLNISNCFRFKHLSGETESDADKRRKETLSQTRQSILDGVKANFYLHNIKVSANSGFDVYDNVSDDEDDENSNTKKKKDRDAKAVLRGISFYTHLNARGRYLLTDAHALSPTVWCHVLAKSLKLRYGKSMAFYYLVEQPLLVSPLSGTTIRKRRRIEFGYWEPT